MNSVVTLTAALACAVVQQGDLYRLVSPYDHDYASMSNVTSICGTPRGAGGMTCSERGACPCR